MNPNLQTFAQHLINCQAATTVEQKLAFLKSAREYVTNFSPPIDALCLNTAFNLQVFGHLVLFEELLLLIETVLKFLPRMELILPVFEFIERIGYNCNEEFMAAVLQMCGHVFTDILPHILEGRATQLSASWRLCWQTMSCLGQSLGVRSLTSQSETLQLAGIAFIEILVLLYTKPILLTTAGSGRGAPTADMFLFNCRYLIDRLTDQISAENLVGQGPVAIVRSLARIVAEREKYFDALVPYLLKLTEKSQYKIAHVSTSTTSLEDSAEAQMTAALKESLLSLLDLQISNRQKSMLLLGLSQLGAKDEALPFHRDIPNDQQSGTTSWNYISDATPETPQAKRIKLDARKTMSLTDEASLEDVPLPSSQEAALNLVEKAKSIFHGKLTVAEVRSVFDILNRSQHKDCLSRIIDHLNHELVASLVVHTFASSKTIELAEMPKKATNPSVKAEPIKDTKIDAMEIDSKPLPSSITNTMRPQVLSLGERQMLIEYSSVQLLKHEIHSDVDDLPLGAQFLSKLASRGQVSNIPLHVLTEYIGQQIHFKAERVSELCIQFLFDLFVTHGNSSTGSYDVATVLQTVQSVDERQLQHPYDQAMYKILNKVSRSEIEGKDKLLKNLLLEAPALPPLVIFDFFQKQLSGDAATAISYLITSNALMESQPALKPVLLECVLQTCTSENSETREKGIRLVKNKLHQDVDLAERIEAFASESLNQLISFEGDIAEDSADMAKRYCHLYLALCTRKASLLKQLLDVYAQASDAGRTVLQENAKQLSEATHFLLSELLQSINTTSKEAEPLLLLLLSIFPDKSPPQKVIDACLKHYEKTKNVRYLVPILPGLPKKRVMELVPLLTQLSLPDFSAAVTDLVGQLPFGDSTVDPGEILVSLSSYSEMQGNSETLNAVRTALDYCIKQMASVFDKEVLAGALNKLIHMHTLPVLFMRMVLLSVSREKELSPFVLQSILSASAISSKIKPDAAQWRGYLLLLRKLTPASFRHLLTLPSRLMAAAVKEMPTVFAERFLEFVESDACDVRASKEALSAIRECVSGCTDTSPSIQSQLKSTHPFVSETDIGQLPSQSDTVPASDGNDMEFETSGE